MGFFLNGLGNTIAKEDIDAVIENVSNSVIEEIDDIIDDKFEVKTQALTNSVNEVVKSQAVITEKFNNSIQYKVVE